MSKICQFVLISKPVKSSGKNSVSRDNTMSCYTMNICQLDCWVKSLIKNTENNTAEIIQSLEQVHIALA